MKQESYNSKLKVKIDGRARILGQTAIYHPFTRLPAIKLDYYAMACLEIVLEHSQDARSIYSEVVKSWELPGCQPVIDEFAKHTSDVRVWYSEVAEAAVKHHSMPDFPKALEDACIKYQDDTDFRKLLNYSGSLILIGFNRKNDLENQTPKVLPSRALYLARAISFYSICEYLHTNPLKNPNPENLVLGGELYDFSQILTSNHTNREDRRLKQEIISKLRDRGFSLCHDETISAKAELWHKARVVSNTLREAADKESLDPIDLSKRIAICDDATGYPRHK